MTEILKEMSASMNNSAARARERWRIHCHSAPSHTRLELTNLSRRGQRKVLSFPFSLAVFTALRFNPANSSTKGSPSSPRLPAFSQVAPAKHLARKEPCKLGSFY